MLPPNTLIQGRYLILEAIGQGGMGAVYKATDMRLRNTVALKETLVTGDVAQRAFEREAQLLASLRHPALPKVSDHFADERGTFLVMEFIPGKDLAALLAAQGAPFPVNDVLRWGDQLLDALEYLHSRQPSVIHRDIKPQNLKLTDRNEIILLDFGLAKGAIGQQTRLTTASVFGYTPHYAPLEQIQGVGTDPRSDLYGVAATLYHLLTNQIPADALRRAAARIADDPDPLAAPHELNPTVPEPVSLVLLQALSQKPADRPTSAAELRQALRDALEGIGPMASSSGQATILMGGTPPGGLVRAKPDTRPPGRPQTQPSPRLAGAAPATQVYGADTVVGPAAPPRGAPVWAWAAGAAAVVLAVVGIFLAMSRGDGGQAAVAPPPSDTAMATSTPGPPTPTIDILMAAAATQTAQAEREAAMLATARMLLDETAGAATQTAVALIPTDTPLPPTETVAPSETTGPTNTVGPTNTLGPTRTPRPTLPPTATPTVDPNPPTATAAATPTPEPPVASGEVLSLGNGSLFRGSVDIGSGPAEGQTGTCIQGRVSTAEGGKFSRFGVQVDNRGSTRQANIDANSGTYGICGLGEGEWGVSVFTAGGVDIPAAEQVAHQVRVRLSGRPGEIFFISFRALPAFTPPTPTPTPLVGPYDGQWAGQLAGKTAGGSDFTGNFRMEIRANALYRVSIDGPSCLFETYPNFPNGLPLSGNGFSLNGSPSNPQTGTDGSIVFSITGTFASTSQASGLLNASQNGGSCAVATWSATKR